METTNPITLSGFNGIDFNTMIDAIIQADSQPLTDLHTQQQNTQNKDTNRRQAADAARKKDIERKRQSIDRAVAILQHLQSTLDRERGEAIAADLDKLYNYIISQALRGSAKLDSAPLEEAAKLLMVVLSGWEQLEKKEPRQAVPSVLLTQRLSPMAFGFRV